jgi:WD40 repeat protein/DNA-binding SARP family transcriptional activator/energy-coupling factor transporter ATP-binding protein EcfA2
MGIAVLGPLTWDGSARLGPRDRVVLAVLATRPGHPVAPDRIVDALWGETPPATAGKVLQGCIARLRKVMGSEAIATSTQGYALTLPFDEIDSMQFERLVIRGRELLTLGEADRAAYLLTQALSLWRGEAFAEVESWPPAADEARRLGELRLEAEELRVDAHLRAGRHDEVLAQAQALVRAAPLRERRWTLLALAQYQSGAQGEALRTIHQLKSVLARQLGIDAGHDVMALEQAILRQDTSLLSAPGLAPSAANCPWQGLKPYGEGDADRFFGRDTDVDSCLEILRRTSLLVLVGPSGCGKSSLLQAGVGATLRGRGRPTVSITPGTHPMQAITALGSTALGRAGPDTVLSVDQFEELFSLCAEVTERQEFLDAITAQAAARTVVVALRADHLADLASSPAFSRLVERGLYLVGGLEDRSLREAIQGPARQAGLVIEPGLVDVLVGEVKDDPGALPLLSHALLETWKRREGNTLTVAGYRATGGIHDAVAQSAERLYARVEVDQRQLLRDLVLRLVSPGAQGEPVRSRVPRRLIASDTEHAQLFELLVGARLVTSDDGVLEITHEALARAWPRLRGWLDDDVEGQRMLHHLSSSADAWDSLSRPDSELYRGIRLARVLDWQQLGRTALTDTEREFLDVSRRAVEAEERTAVERAKTQARLIRRLRGVLTGAAILLVAALVAGLLAVRQADHARNNADDAAAAQTRSDARAAGAKALVTDDIDTSMLLAVAGVRMDDSPATRSSLLATLGKHPALIASIPMAGKEVLRHDVSPDGRTVATYDEGHRVRLYEIESGELLREFQAGSDERLGEIAGDIAFSPDGSTLAVMNAAPTRQPVMLLDADTLEPLDVQPGGVQSWRWLTEDLAYSRNGRVLAAILARVQGTAATTKMTSSWAVVWDSGNPRQPIRRIHLADGSFSLALSPDGRFLYTSLQGQPLRPRLMRHDLVTGRSIPLGDDPLVYMLAASPDGTLLAGSADHSVLLLDARTGDVLRELPTGSNAPWLVTFSNDGSLLSTIITGDQEALVWDVATGELQARLPLADSGEQVAFSPDGSTLYTAGADASLRRWDLDGSRRFLAQVAPPTGFGWGESVAVAPGGGHVAYQLWGGEGVVFLDVRAGTLGRTLERPSGSTGLWGVWDPHGSLYALPTGDQVTIWDARTGDVVSQGRAAGSEVTGIDFSTDGSRLAIAEVAGAVVMVDPATLEPLGAPVRLDDVPCAVSLGPDNRTAFVATGPRKSAWEFWAIPCSDWALVDLESGSVLDRGTTDGGIGRIDFSPAGDRVAVDASQGLVVIDLETGRPARPPVAVHDRTVLSLVYSPDGSRILTSGTDASAALWDAETGQLIARVVTPPLFSVSQFLADGRSVLVADEYAGAVYRWDTRPDYAVEFACRLAGRDLTKAEWAEQFGNRTFQETCPS